MLTGLARGTSGDIRVTVNPITLSWDVGSIRPNFITSEPLDRANLRQSIANAVNQLIGELNEN
jgi:hypothetical protein